MTDRPQDLGTEDLEAGMRPSKASHVIAIAAIFVVILLVFNPRSIVEWARHPQAGPVISSFERPATVWHGWMKDLGLAAWFDDFRQRVQKAIAP